ncbi:hypothetical protein HRTV-25_gp67 [Halorubrum tailed virus 25]|uniref:Uncharacterized protein n=1 Tax=Halorubrum tailed virus 25 TaxID=2878006 RepID=A0AAE8Y141_9CAUD|nr:hypothetical protein M1M37_gp067 [Halorubrum tailed virus 25]UBF22648.1 hypothetical protein HRTV-25_gp67 [Halorubrum tailed virus 25]
MVGLLGLVVLRFCSRWGCWYAVKQSPQCSRWELNHTLTPPTPIEGHGRGAAIGS